MAIMQITYCGHFAVTVAQQRRAGVNLHIVQHGQVTKSKVTQLINGRPKAHASPPSMPFDFFPGEEGQVWLEGKLQSQ